MKKPQAVRFRKKEAIAALASPLRMEILQEFEGVDGLTVRELATRIGRPQESLYYHVKKLVAIGALVEVERNLKGKRWESVYGPAGSRFEVDPGSEGDSEVLGRLTGALMRSAARELKSAVDDGVLAEKNCRPLVRRVRARLTAADLDRIEKLFGEIEAICVRRKRQGSGRLFAVTSLLVPVEKSAPTKAMKAVARSPR